MFEIKLIFLRSKLYVAIFWICMSAKFSVWDVFNNFLLIDATDRSKISSDQKRFFIALILYPLSFFANIPFKKSNCNWCSSKANILTSIALKQKWRVNITLVIQTFKIMIIVFFIYWSNLNTSEMNIPKKDKPEIFIFFNFIFLKWTSVSGGRI